MKALGGALLGMYARTAAQASAVTLKSSIKLSLLTVPTVLFCRPFGQGGSYG